MTMVEGWKVHQPVNCKALWALPSGSAPLFMRVQYLSKSYLWQYHSPWQREHLFAASFPQDPHFGFSGSKLSITSKLYVCANLVKTINYLNNGQSADELSNFSVTSVLSQTSVFGFTSVPVVSGHFLTGWMFLSLDTLLLPSTSHNSHSQCCSTFLGSIHKEKWV